MGPVIDEEGDEIQISFQSGNCTFVTFTQMGTTVLLDVDLSLADLGNCTVQVSMSDYDEEGAKISSNSYDISIEVTEQGEDDSESSSSFSYNRMDRSNEEAEE